MHTTGKLLIAAAAFAAFTGAASAADLYVPPASSPAPFSAPAVSSWDGLYIGALIGYSQGTANNVDSSTVGQIDTTGWQLGVQGGYNFHISDNIVAGVSADLVWDNASGSTSTPISISEQRNWDGSITGRLGVDLNGIVPYVLGGVAFANDTRTNFVPESVSTTHTGYTLGAGVEFALAQNLSANVEYRYTNYGNQDYAFPTAGTHTINLTDNSIRVGLNYHFN